MSADHASAFINDSVISLPDLNRRVQFIFLICVSACTYIYLYVYVQNVGIDMSKTKIKRRPLEGSLQDQTTGKPEEPICQITVKRHIYKTVELCRTNY